MIFDQFQFVSRFAAMNVLLNSITLVVILPGHTQLASQVSYPIFFLPTALLCNLIMSLFYSDCLQSTNEQFLKSCKCRWLKQTRDKGINKP